MSNSILLTTWIKVVESIEACTPIKSSLSPCSPSSMFYMEKSSRITYGLKTYYVIWIYTCKERILIHLYSISNCTIGTLNHCKWISSWKWICFINMTNNPTCLLISIYRVSQKKRNTSDLEYLKNGSIKFIVLLVCYSVMPHTIL